jgi:hypothetical protein
MTDEFNALLNNKLSISKEAEVNLRVTLQQWPVTTMPHLKCLLVTMEIDNYVSGPTLKNCAVIFMFPLSHSSNLFFSSQTGT